MRKRIAKKIMKRCKWPYERYEYVCHSSQDVALLFKALKHLHLKWRPKDAVTLITEKDYWEI